MNAEALHVGDRRTFRFASWGLLALLGAASLVSVEFRPWAFFSPMARENGADFAARAWPPAGGAELLSRFASLALDTLAIAACGTAVAVVIGLPLGILGSRAVMQGSLFVTGDVPRRPWLTAAYFAARGTGAVLRSVPELVWALLFVRIYGLGPSAAVLAIGLAYGGMLAKVYSEQIESVNARPVTALETVGAGRFACFAFGILPLASGEMVGYSAYRFECAIRAGAILGMVGAGGLGQQIEESHLNLAYGEMVTAVLFLMGLVVFVETVSDQIKRRFP
ncbi:MAG: Phosphate-import permease protein PhnE [Planctomycetes bacterium]|nr:Phosphate-import permease protein PhnE [Planctomycetota bacterium]